MIAEYDAAGLKTRFVRGQAPDEVLVEYQGGTPITNKRWLFADERGSIVGGANSSGASQFKNAYDEYGRPSPTNTGRFQYTGQMWLSEIGLYHYKARLYSPNLGRFLQTDPIGYADGLNLYAYVGNDPINATDPSGLATVCFTGGNGDPICHQVDGGGGGCGACGNPAPGLFPGGFPANFGGTQLGGESGGGRDRSLDDEIVVTGNRSDSVQSQIAQFSSYALSSSFVLETLGYYGLPVELFFGVVYLFNFAPDPSMASRLAVPGLPRRLGMTLTIGSNLTGAANPISSFGSLNASCCDIGGALGLSLSLQIFSTAPRLLFYDDPFYGPRFLVPISDTRQ